MKRFVSHLALVYADKITFNILPILCMVLFITSCKKDPIANVIKLTELEDYSSLTLFPADMATKRGNQDLDGWAISPNTSTGPFVISPLIDQLGAGSARALITLKIPDNSSLLENVATIRIFDTQTNKLLSLKELYKNDFSHNDTYQSFELYFETTDASSIELKIIWHGGTKLTFRSAFMEVYRHRPGMPEFINKSGISDAHARQLAQQALDGLGFSSNAQDGPSKKDIIFVGKYYIAWIDQTGFYGKMNGLWLLNGLTGESSDFLHKENGRPVNFFGVAEKGDGKWMLNYVGAEHYELPQLINEPGEPPYGMEFANWYSVNEAGKILGSNLPHWKSAMNYRMGFSILNVPFERSESADQLYINYESPLTKESDGDLIKDGDHAHADMIFADLIRYPFYLRTGYTLYGDQPYFERHYQYRNEENNPPFTTKESGNWNLIGGLVITDYRSPYTYKTGLNKYVRLNEFSLNGLPVQSWVDVSPPRNAPPDALWHYSQSYTMSNNATFEAGNSIHISASSTGSRVDDMGGCTCFVHGGLEIGGGVLGGRVLPLAPGQLSAIDTRHFVFPQNNDELVKISINRP